MDTTSNFEESYRETLENWLSFEFIIDISTRDTGNLFVQFMTQECLCQFTWLSHLLFVIFQHS